jgi:epsilon-lactone hydrolase
MRFFESQRRWKDLLQPRSKVAVRLGVVVLNQRGAGMKRKLCLACVMSITTCAATGALASLSAQEGQAASQSPRVVIDANGTIHVPAESVPLSSLLSPSAKAYMARHLREMQQPYLSAEVGGVPRRMEPLIKRDKALFDVSRTDERVGGVHVYVYVPTTGIASKNKDRVLIELHGGGFSGCWPACAELESMPVSALMKIKVIAVDYRQGPKYKFPAASEDVANVYEELLKTYEPKNIGIYGCSAGGKLTAESEAWFQKHSLPSPGAIGIYCAGAFAGFGGDSLYVASPIGEAQMPDELFGKAGAQELPRLGYFSNAKPDDPLVAPIKSPQILAKFPPTLIITADRDIEMSLAIYTHEQLVKEGVDAELHVWEGLFHAFFYDADVPESRDAFSVMVKFFDRHLGQ